MVLRVRRHTDTMYRYTNGVFAIPVLGPRSAGHAAVHRHEREEDHPSSPSIGNSGQI
jgi:hypothetical protein